MSKNLDKKWNPQPWDCKEQADVPAFKDLIIEGAKQPSIFVAHPMFSHGNVHWGKTNEELVVLHGYYIAASLSEMQATNSHIMSVFL